MIETSTLEKLRQFDDILTQAIREGIEKVVGDRVGKTIEYHANPKMALVDAGAFAGRLEKLFGPASGIILEAILLRLSELVGYGTAEGRAFEESVRDLEERFSKGRRQLRAA